MRVEQVEQKSLAVDRSTVPACSEHSVVCAGCSDTKLKHTMLSRPWGRHTTNFCAFNALISALATTPSTDCPPCLVFSHIYPRIITGLYTKSGCPSFRAQGGKREQIGCSRRQIHRSHGSGLIPIIPITRQRSATGSNELMSERADER